MWSSSTSSSTRRSTRWSRADPTPRLRSTVQDHIQAGQPSKRDVHAPVPPNVRPARRHARRTAPRRIPAHHLLIVWNRRVGGKLSVDGHGHPEPFRRPAQSGPVPLAETGRLHHEQGFQFGSEFLEKRSSTIGRKDRPPHLHAVTIASHGPVLGPRITTSALHRDGQPLQAIGRHQMNSVAEGPLLVMLIHVQQRPRLPSVLPPTQGRKRAKGKTHRAGNQRTDLNIRSQRIPDSPCCALFILLNHVNAARPTTWSSGTKPQYRLSAELWRLSPISQ